MNEILAGHRSSQGNQDPSSSFTTITPDPPPMSVSPNPESTGDTASNQTHTNGGEQQSPTAAAAHKPGNDPQNPLLSNGTTADDNTDDSHTSLTHNEDSADSAVRAVGGAHQNFQSTKGAYKPETDQHEAALGHQMFSIGGNAEEVLQSEGNQDPPNPRTAFAQMPPNGGAAANQPDNERQNLVGATGGASYQDGIVTKNYDYRQDPPNPRTAFAQMPPNGGAAANQPDNERQNLVGTTGGASYQDGIVTKNYDYRQGFKSDRCPSPTELSYRSFQEPASTILSRQIYNSVSQPLVTDGKGYRGSTLNNVIPLVKQWVELPEGYVGEGRRHSYPYNAPKKEEQDNMKRSFSEATMKERKIKLDDPLAKTILDRLDLLEELSRCLDKEYKYGRNQCWKHVAEYFGIDEEKYQSFGCSKIHSPTEEMFDYLDATDTKLTIGKLKEKLLSVERQDVIDVLVEYEKTDCSVKDGTLVCSLFDSNPDIIGRIAFLLDGQKLGLKNWVQLAGKLDIPKKVSKSFETCNTDNPTEGLFEYLKTHLPEMKVEKLITHLEAMQRRDVVKAIKGTTEGKSVSFIKDLVKDVLFMDKLCELLNWKRGPSKMPWWKELGARLNISTDILDDLSPPQVYECPTEALIRYLGSWRPYLKIADFIRALDQIDRHDAINVMKGYLPDGCVPGPL
ncbi:uncharacterized protein [Acropora muricata]|uniref:uncharacterized protein n=1 Tax=Acropora muricata TaxID=159855 RepID=UPI0034E5EAAD